MKEFVQSSWRVDISGCCFFHILVQGEKHERLGCAAHCESALPWADGTELSHAPLYTSNPCPCSRAGPDHPLITAHLLPLLNHSMPHLGRRYKGWGSWGVWEEVGAESSGSVQAGRANIVLGICNEVLPGFCFPGRGFSYSPLPTTPPLSISLAVSLIILKIKNKTKCSST